jgi:hypothetical protein
MEATDRIGLAELQIVSPNGTRTVESWFPGANKINAGRESVDMQLRRGVALACRGWMRSAVDLLTIMCDGNAFNYYGFQHNF